MKETTIRILTVPIELQYIILLERSFVKTWEANASLIIVWSCIYLIGIKLNSSAFIAFWYILIVIIYSLFIIIRGEMYI